jgi:hypothetical protein
LNFLNAFSKNPQILTFMKICPVGAQLFHEERQTDRRADTIKLIAAIRNFANAANKSIWSKKITKVPEHGLKPQSDVSKDDVRTKMEKHKELAELHIYTSHPTAKDFVHSSSERSPFDTVGVLGIRV